MTIEIGKKYVFNTAYAELQEYNGTKVEIIRQLTKAECDVDEEGNMYEAKFIDGSNKHVLRDELNEETKEIKVKTKGGYLCATDSGDINYPGIDIEYVADQEDENIKSRPRIVFEYPQEGRLRVLIWEDKDSEDYTREIIFSIGEREDANINRINIVMKALKVDEEDAQIIVDHLIKEDCEEWIDDYDKHGKDEPLTDVHYEASFDKMIDWQYEGSSPSEILGRPAVIEEYPEMLQLKEKVIFWYGLV